MHYITCRVLSTQVGNKVFGVFHLNYQNLSAESETLQLVNGILNCPRLSVLTEYRVRRKFVQSRLEFLFRGTPTKKCSREYLS